MIKNINIANILENAQNLDENSTLKNSHILSNISYDEVILLSDESNSLLIKTLENDILTLDSKNWEKSTSNDEKGYSTFVSTNNSAVSILVDETKVDLI